MITKDDCFFTKPQLMILALFVARCSTKHGFPPFKSPAVDHSMSIPPNIQEVAMNVTSHKYKTQKTHEPENLVLNFLGQSQAFLFRF